MNAKDQDNARTALSASHLSQTPICAPIGAPESMPIDTRPQGPFPAVRDIAIAVAQRAPGRSTTIRLIGMAKVGAPRGDIAASMPARSASICKRAAGDSTKAA